jgi:hypothetical protein
MPKFPVEFQVDTYLLGFLLLSLLWHICFNATFTSFMYPRGTFRILLISICISVNPLFQPVCLISCRIVVWQKAKRCCLWRAGEVSRWEVATQSGKLNLHTTDCGQFVFPKDLPITFAQKLVG